MRVISIQTLCAPLESILICSFLVSFAIKFNRCSHFLHCLVWGMSSDVEAFFKHGDYWPVYEKDWHLQISICRRRQMQFVGGHKFWPSRSSVVYTLLSVCAQSLHTPFCATSTSPLAHKRLTGSQHRPEVRKSWLSICPCSP